MFLVWLISVPLLLFLVWAVVTDLRRRRAGRVATTDHSVDRAARTTRTESETKGTEWGAGGF
jgi:hypothetical protein